MKRITLMISLSIVVSICSGSVFEYGIASKGPLSLWGSDVNGVNNSFESNLYIESLADCNALELINSQIAGDVEIVNPDASAILLGGRTGIGGEFGQDAIDHHVQFGASKLIFPYPNTAHFTPYLSGQRLTESYISVPSSYQNMTIPAGINPHFTSNVQLKGIIYIESPNRVTFAGDVDITGIIVATGDPLDDSAANTIDFQGSITSHSITTLDETFDSQLKNETGTFLIAPGFKVSIGGSFDNIYGTIAANGIEFYGYAGGTIKGAILNYSEKRTFLSGLSDFHFDRSGVTSAPAGFNSPTLKLCSVNGGEHLAGGDEYLIRWFGNVVLANVSLEYSIDNGANWLMIESQAENSGLYGWIVPTTDSNQCLVRITSIDYPWISDISDAPFTITPPYTCNAYLPMDFNEDCKVDLADFAVFVEHWMECHRDPIEACNQ